MRAGNLDREITLEQWLENPQPDEYGNVHPVWSAFATVRTQLVQANTDEFLAAYGESDKTVLIFRIRPVMVTTDHRVVYLGKPYDIKEIKEIGRRKGMELRCEVVT